MNNNKSIISFLAVKFAIYLLAVLAAYLLASITATQSVVASLTGMGLEVSFENRLSMTLKDTLGIASLFLPMVAFALLIAFMSSALLYRFLGKWRTALYVIAGAVAVISIHLGLKLAFGITPIAIARSPGGLLAQGVAGAAGGFSYIWLLKKFYSQPSRNP
jgi:mannose/fructose/N-acetylgalactosamine-specific phosphotransferase system component IIC